jgi:hypothetical protein
METTTGRPAARQEHAIACHDGAPRQSRQFRFRVYISVHLRPKKMKTSPRSATIDFMNQKRITNIQQGTQNDEVGCRLLGLSFNIETKPFVKVGD